MCSSAFWTVLPCGSSTAFYGVIMILAFISKREECRTCNDECRVLSSKFKIYARGIHERVGAGAWTALSAKNLAEAFENQADKAVRASFAGKLPETAHLQRVELKPRFAFCAGEVADELDIHGLIAHVEVVAGRSPIGRI